MSNDKNTKQSKYNYAYVATCASWDKTINALITDVFGVYNSLESAQIEMYKKANRLYKYYGEGHNSNFDIWDTGADINIDNENLYFSLRIHKKKK